MEYAGFLQNLLETALYLIQNENLVVWPQLQEMLETPCPLPISFIPKTRFWTKITSMVSENHKKFDTKINRIKNTGEVKVVLNQPETNNVLTEIIQNIAHNAKMAIDEIKEKLYCTKSLVIPNGEDLYPKALDIKKAFKGKQKCVGQLMNTSKIFILCNILLRKMSELNNEELALNDKEIQELLDAEKWDNLPTVCNELKVFSKNIMALE